MKATGIVRRIDDLGRVVIPKEIRRTMRIREGAQLLTDWMMKYRSVKVFCRLRKEWRLHKLFILRNLVYKVPEDFYITSYKTKQ